MSKLKIVRKKELVASSRGNTVRFHDKGYTVTRAVSSYVPPTATRERLNERDLEETYFKNGRYSGDKSVVRGRLIKIASRKRDAIDLTTKPLIHVEQNQLESCGWKAEKK